MNVETNGPIIIATLFILVLAYTINSGLTKKREKRAADGLLKIEGFLGEANWKAAIDAAHKLDGTELELSDIHIIIQDLKPRIRLFEIFKIGNEAKFFAKQFEFQNVLGYLPKPISFFSQIKFSNLSFVFPALIAVLVLVNTQLKSSSLDLCLTIATILNILAALEHTWLHYKEDRRESLKISRSENLMNLIRATLTPEYVAALQNGMAERIEGSEVESDVLNLTAQTDVLNLTDSDISSLPEFKQRRRKNK